MELGDITKAVANYFLDLGDQDGVPLSPMKLQKLLYYAHGWYLALMDKPLLDESVEAWPWGPVIPSIYHEFKRFGSDPIYDERCLNVVPGPGTKLTWTRPALLADVERSVLDKVWSVYKGFTAIQLSNMSHQPGSPWQTTWDLNDGKRSVDISDDVIKSYFKTMMKK